MILLQFLVFVAFIALGAWLGGIGVGFAGGAGVLVLGLLGAKPGDLPMLVIVFIMVVIYAASAMQAAGGVDYLVGLTDRTLRRAPRLLNVCAPLVTFTLTLMASTGQVSFATMPVIVEVAKENNIKPTRALSVGVAGSLLGITASPISAATVFLSSELEKGNTGWTFIDLLLVVIPSTLVGTVLTAALFMVWDRVRGQHKLWSDEEYAEYLRTRPEPVHKSEERVDSRGRLSVIIFLIALVAVLTYSILISEKVGVIHDPVVDASQARISAMLAAGGPFSSCARWIRPRSPSPLFSAPA